MRKGAATVLIVLAACNGGPTATAPPPSTTSTTNVPTPTAAVPTTLPQVGCLAGELPFSNESGSLSLAAQEGDLDPDARQIAAWSLSSEPACDRLTVTLATEGGAPARVAGHVEASLLLNEGVLRVTLDPAVGGTAVVDHLFEGRFAFRAFVVRSLTGRLFFDVHLARAVTARVFVDRAPAVITVDLAQGSQPIGDPVVADSTVILDPADPRQSYPFVAMGYVRGDEITAVIRGESEESDPITGEVAEGAGIWAEYRVLIPGGPTGIVMLDINGSEKLLDLS